MWAPPICSLYPGADPHRAGHRHDLIAGTMLISILNLESRNAIQAKMQLTGKVAVHTPSVQGSPSGMSRPFSALDASHAEASAKASS